MQHPYGYTPKPGRNLQVIEDRKSGMRLRDIAAKHDISLGRVQQILIRNKKPRDWIQLIRATKTSS